MGLTPQMHGLYLVGKMIDEPSEFCIVITAEDFPNKGEIAFLAQGATYLQWQLWINNMVCAVAPCSRLNQFEMPFIERNGITWQPRNTFKTKNGTERLVFERR